MGARYAAADGRLAARDMAIAAAAFRRALARIDPDAAVWAARTAEGALRTALASIEE